MKRISHNENSRDKLLHIETELGIVNIRTGLTDSEGRRVESIEVIPDSTNPAVVLDGKSNTRLIEGGDKKARGLEVRAAIHAALIELEYLKDCSIVSENGDGENVKVNENIIKNLSDVFHSL